MEASPDRVVRLEMVLGEGRIVQSLGNYDAGEYARQIGTSG